MIAIVVHDHAFSSNAHVLLHEFESKISGTFDVRLLEKITNFISWNISCSIKGIRIDQRKYTTEILKNLE